MQSKTENSKALKIVVKVDLFTTHFFHALKRAFLNIFNVKKRIIVRTDSGHTSLSKPLTSVNANFLFLFPFWIIHSTFS